MSVIKVSVILPVCNAGERLGRCLETLVHQTLKEIEIICVLDCPTDGSGQAVRQAAAMDSRIVVIENTESLHVGESRNRGLEVARGRYIGFSDHDDYRELTMYEELFEEAERSKADIVLSNCCMVPEGDADRLEAFRFPETIDPTEAFHALLSLELMSSSPSYSNIRSVWNCLYRREFLQHNDITFPDTRKICHEDILFNTRCYFHQPKAVYLNRDLYMWITHSDSTLNSSRYYNVCSVLAHLEADAEMAGDDLQLQELLQTGAIRKIYSMFYGRKSLPHWIRLSREINHHMPEYHRIEAIMLSNDNVARKRLSIPKRLVYTLFFRQRQRRTPRR